MHQWYHLRVELYRSLQRHRPCSRNSPQRERERPFKLLQINPSMSSSTLEAGFILYINITT